MSETENGKRKYRKGENEARVASYKAKCTFHIEGEQPQQELLLFYRMLATRPKLNTTAGRTEAARNRARLRPVDQHVIEK